MSPLQYQKALRLQEARRLLAEQVGLARTCACSACHGGAAERKRGRGVLERDGVFTGARAA